MSPPPPKAGSLLGPASAGGEALVRDRKSKLLFGFELGNDDLSGPLASDPLVLASLVVGGQPWGVGAAGYNHARQR